MTTKLKIKDYQANYTLSDDPENAIREAIHTVLGTSRQEIIESITPAIEKAVSKKVLEIANRICRNFTYDELLPDRE